MFPSTEKGLGPLKHLARGDSGRLLAPGGGHFRGRDAKQLRPFPR